MRVFRYAQSTQITSLQYRKNDMLDCFDVEFVSASLSKLKQQICNSWNTLHYPDLFSARCNLSV